MKTCYPFRRIARPKSARNRSRRRPPGIETPNCPPDYSTGSTVLDGFKHRIHTRPLSPPSHHISKPGHWNALWYIFVPSTVLNPAPRHSPPDPLAHSDTQPRHTITFPTLGVSPNHSASNSALQKRGHSQGPPPPGIPTSYYHYTDINIIKVNTIPTLGVLHTIRHHCPRSNLDIGTDHRRHDLQRHTTTTPTFHQFKKSHVTD